MGLDIKSSSVRKVYSVLAFADLKGSAESGCSIRLSRIEPGTTAKAVSFLVVTESGNWLAGSDNYDLLESIVLVAGSPNMPSKYADLSKAIRSDKVAAQVLEAVLKFRESGVMPTKVGDTGLEFRAADQRGASSGSSGGPAGSLAEALAKAKAGRGGTAGAPFRRSRVG